MAVATERPTWFQAILDDYRAAVSNSFLVHGNVFDYVEHPEESITPTPYLSQVLSTRFLVVTYSPDEGIVFPSTAADESKRNEAVFREVTGFGQGESTQIYGDEGGEEPLPSEPESALPLIITFLRRADPEGFTSLYGRRGAAIVERMDLITPPGDKATTPPGRLALLSLLHRVGHDDRIAELTNLLIMFAPLLEEVHSDLRAASSGIRSIEIAAPDYPQRLAFCQRTIQEKELTLDGITAIELAAQTAGLFRRHIEDICLRAVRDGGTITRELIQERKAEAIQTEYSGLIEIVDPKFGFDAVGGHELAIDFLKRRVVRTMTDPALVDKVPMGLLFTGPSGTGKTFVADALSNEIGFNSVRGNIDALRGGIVGETGQRAAKFFAGLRALAPCVVFIDEIEQAFRRGTGGPDSGGGGAAENSLFASMLTFFGDPSNRGRILAIGATNRPDGLDPAVKRPGRFDITIPFLVPPTAEDRAEVMVRVSRRLGYGEISNEQFVGIARETDDWTQAELEGLVREASTLVELDGLTLAEALTEARADMVSATADVRYWTDLALKSCNKRSLVPERYRAQMGGGVAEIGARERDSETNQPQPVRRGGQLLDLEDIR